MRARPGRVKIDPVRLSNARLAREMSLEEVAEALGDGCNKSSVSRWEQGVLNPSKDRVHKLVDLYGTNDFVVERV